MRKSNGAKRIKDPEYQPELDEKAYKSAPKEILKPDKRPTKANRSNNKYGHNQHTNNDPYFPYSVRAAQAKSLLDQGFSIREILSITALSKDTISKIKNNEIAVSMSLVNEIKKGESAKFRMKYHQILDAITVEDVEKASLMQKASSFGILFDKRRLVDGESTENLSHRGMVESIREQKDQIEAEIKALREEE